MPDVSSIECLSTNLYAHHITVASSVAVENFLNRLQNFIDERTTTAPLYLLLDASSLDIAYTPRVRERVEVVISRVYDHKKTIRIAFVLPQTMSTCTVFMNNMLRHRETSQVRHLCFARREEALTWLENLQHRESLPAAQGF